MINRTQIRYICVGIWNTIFGYFVFFTLNVIFASQCGDSFKSYMPAIVLGNLLAIINAFIFHKYVTFRSSIKGIGILKEFIKFFLTYSASFILSLVLMPVLVEVFHFQPNFSAALIIIICTYFSYYGNLTYSFKNIASKS